MLLPCDEHGRVEGEPEDRGPRAFGSTHIHSQWGLPNDIQRGDGSRSASTEEWWSDYVVVNMSYCLPQIANVVAIISPRRVFQVTMQLLL